MALKQGRPSHPTPPRHGSFPHGRGGAQPPQPAIFLVGLTCKEYTHFQWFMAFDTRKAGADALAAIGVAVEMALKPANMSPAGCSHKL